MGITSRAVAFTAAPPTLDEIVAAMERISALPIVIQATSPHPMYRFHAELAFACKPREHVVVIAYAERSYVHTRGFISEEGTLHGVIELALESLGGASQPSMSDGRRAACSMTLTPEMLDARHFRHRVRWFTGLFRR